MEAIIAAVVIAVAWVVVKKIRGPLPPNEEPRLGGAPHNPEDPTINPNKR